MNQKPTYEELERKVQDLENIIGEISRKEGLRHRSGKTHFLSNVLTAFYKSFRIEC